MQGQNIWIENLKVVSKKLSPLFLVGADLPSSAISIGSVNYVHGTKMLPTPTNDGLILYSNKAFYQ